MAHMTIKSQGDITNAVHIVPLFEVLGLTYSLIYNDNLIYKEHLFR